MKSFFLFIERMPRSLRLLISLTVGVLVFLAAKTSHGVGLPFLFAWISFATTSLLFTWTTILVRQPNQTGVIARKQDDKVWIIFLLVISAAFVSLFAIILLLQDLPSYSKKGLSLHMALSIVSVALSWVLIHSVFTIRYAHLYYDLREKKGKENNEKNFAGGLEFPGGEAPDFMDFAYFSFVLGMTFQVADVNITGRPIRRLALLHGFLSFIYNTAIIALSINIISGLIGK
ncbi:MAG: DUF1345 domain-containing protein [Bacteroidota bacterium]|nr:DUF1345 domain-containing protein [Bacteroidota bacterium]